MGTENNKVTAPTYGALSQRHRDYDAELWERLSLLFIGGWAIMKRAKDFLLRAPRENQQYYDWRCQNTSYVNYFARLVGFLTGSLFTETLTVQPAADPTTDEPTPPPDNFYSEFALDCDQRGTDFSQFMRVTLASAMVKRRALVHVDLPARSNDVQPVNRADEEALGIGRAYLYEVPLEQLINWEFDARGRFAWCVLQRKVWQRDNPLAPQSTYCHEFKVWTMADGFATYATLRTKMVQRDDELRPDDALTIATQPTVTSFRQFPLLALELPEALWVGNQAGPLCQEHYRRRADLMGSLCRSLVEIPYVKLGPEIPEVHGSVSEAQSDPNRGADILGRARQDGAVQLGAEDELGFAGPSGVAFKLASAEVKECREEIFASVNAMALQLENSAAAVGRSGESKAEDRSSMAIILGFLATQLREFSQEVMQLVSSARGENVKWVASGLNTFNTEDRNQVLSDAIQVQALDVPSRRFHVLSRVKVARAILPNATAKQMAEIESEIDRNTYAEQHVGRPPGSIEDYMSGRVPLPHGHG